MEKSSLHSLDEIETIHVEVSIALSAYQRLAYNPRKTHHHGVRAGCFYYSDTQHLGIRNNLGVVDPTKTSQCVGIAEYWFRFKV